MQFALFCLFLLRYASDASLLSIKNYYLICWGYYDGLCPRYKKFAIVLPSLINFDRAFSYMRFIFNFKLVYEHVWMWVVNSSRLIIITKIMVRNQKLGSSIRCAHHLCGLQKRRRFPHGVEISGHRSLMLRWKTVSKLSILSRGAQPSW